MFGRYLPYQVPTLERWGDGHDDAGINFIIENNDKLFHTTKSSL